MISTDETFFVFSVLPAPLSPVINIDWFLLQEDEDKNADDDDDNEGADADDDDENADDDYEDEDALAPVCHHVPVGCLRDGPEVGGHFVPPLALVDLHHPAGVDGEPLVGVHHHTEQAGVGVDQLGLGGGRQIWDLWTSRGGSPEKISLGSSLGFSTVSQTFLTL